MGLDVRLVLTVDWRNMGAENTAGESEEIDNVLGQPRVACPWHQLGVSHWINGRCLGSISTSFSELLSYC